MEGPSENPNPDSTIRIHNPQRLDSGFRFRVFGLDLLCGIRGPAENQSPDLDPQSDSIIESVQLAGLDVTMILIQIKNSSPEARISGFLFAASRLWFRLALWDLRSKPEIESKSEIQHF